MKQLFLFILLLGIGFSLTAQAPAGTLPKNHFSIQLNNHLEKRGTTGYSTSNPDLIFSYERNLLALGKHHFVAGCRTGGYREYVLTGYGWDHPEKIRFFFGLSPVYLLEINDHIWVQLNFIYDVLLPDDYDEIWSYWAVEPSFQYRWKNFYAGISATDGVFLFFDPKAYFAKAGIKIGFVL